MINPKQKQQNELRYLEAYFGLDFNKVIEENKRLKRELKVAVEKQHQEMSRAIHLHEVYLSLKKRVHEAKEHACTLKESENKRIHHEIELSKKKRIEASRMAKKLAEENYYLGICLSNVNQEIQNLKWKYQRLMDSQYN